jgi:hypothetical protein
MGAVFDLRKSVCLGVAVLVMFAPILACALPGQQMSQEEQTCCLHMADQCDSSQMAESHSCCQKSPQIGAHSLQVTSKYAPVPLDHAVQIIVDSQPKAVATETAASLVIPLPESPPGHTSVLRI